MPSYLYKCETCGLEKHRRREVDNRKLPFICGSCLLPSLMVFTFDVSGFPMVVLRGGVKKKADAKNDPFGGIPIGEVPGDKDYDWVQEYGKDYDIGAIP